MSPNPSLLSPRPSSVRPDVDPVAVSVAAYADHVDAYAASNAAAAAGPFERFVAPLCPADDVVLDAGCGPGRDLVRFAERGFCAVGVDLSPEFLELAAAGTQGWPVRLELADLRDLPFAADEFAGVWACASLVHLDAVGAAAALAEIARVTRPGGPVHVSVKAASSGDDGWEDTPFGRRFFTRWSNEQLHDAAVHAGLAVVEIEPDGAFVNLWAVA